MLYMFYIPLTITITIPTHCPVDITKHHSRTQLYCKCTVCIIKHPTCNYHSQHNDHGSNLLISNSRSTICSFKEESASNIYHSFSYVKQGKILELSHLAKNDAPRKCYIYNLKGYRKVSAEFCSRNTRYRSCIS